MTDQKDLNILEIEKFLSKEEFEELKLIIHRYNHDDTSPGWKFSGYSTPNTRHKPFWKLNLSNEPYFTEHLFEKIKTRIYEMVKEEVELITVYLNGATSGQQGYPHSDSENSDHRTLLIYCNTDWLSEWSGATVFYQLDKNPTTIYPIPGKAVYFKSNITHFSQSISKDYFGIRITLAYKLTIKK